MAARVLVTGGAGFIGSHICKALSRSGLVPVAYDNLSTGHQDNVRWGKLVKADLHDRFALKTALAAFQVECVVHCAANAYVGESVENPQKYYRNNVAGSLALLDACRDQNVERIVFSSSCATYGIPAVFPIDERTEQVPINPYGRTKLIFEMMLRDYGAAYGSRFVTLRYFNASGADPEGELQERHDPETHLIPRALMAASGSGQLQIFGSDYPTPDGTCVRDYIHVSDLARAHVAAVRRLLDGGGSLTLNLGSGRGTSIREVLDAIHRVTKKTVPTSFEPRRAGDPPVLYADTRKAETDLGFRPELSDIDTIIRTAAPSFGLEVLP